MKKTRILPSFVKGLQIWEHIARHPDGMRLVDLSQEMKYPSSNISLYLNTLLSTGLVIRDPMTRRYFVAPMAIEIFRNAGESTIHQLLPFAEDSMTALHKRFNENVLLAIQKENTIVFIKHISTNHIMRIEIEPEPEFPMHMTAAGRAILAFLSEKEINSYIRKAEFEMMTGKTISSEQELRDALRNTQKNGYAFNPGEFEAEVMAVAAPILVDQRPIASLVVQFPTLRHSAKEAEDSAQEIMKQAKKIESKFRTPKEK